MANDELFMENLEEYINDENRVVTYKWLSNTLQVHVNQAKQMLYAFVQDQRNKKDNDHISVTYFIAGLAKSVNGLKAHRCTVLPEEQLEAYKSTLSVITSSHIYSVQKSKLQDTNTLYTSDYDSVKERNCDTNKYSAIKYSKAKLRSADDISKLESLHRKEQQATQATKNTEQTNGTSSTKTTSTLASNKPQKKGSIAGMFANAAANKKADVKEEQDVKTSKEIVKTKEEKTEDKKSSKPAASNKKGGVMSFFSKQEKKAPVKNEKTEKDTESTGPKEIKKSPTTQSKSRTGSNRKTRRNQDSDDESKSKRRRIKEDLFDSSSGEEEMDCEESPVPSPVREPSPTPESPIPLDDEEEKKHDSPKKESPEQKNSTSGEKRRKRTRKLVPKTFMDEDGYMVTEKVWESDSTDASDVEPQPPPKKEAPQKTPNKKSPHKKSPAKTSPPTAGSRKQTSLTSFFKKK